MDDSRRATSAVEGEEEVLTGAAETGRAADKQVGILAQCVRTSAGYDCGTAGAPPNDMNNSSDLRGGGERETMLPGASPATSR